MSLPTGFRVRVHDDVQWAAGGAVLVGGSPLRAMRLSARARSLIQNGEIFVSDAVTAVLAERLLDANIALPVLERSHGVAAAELTVVIPVRDRPEQLGRALAGLRGLTVIVVDDASRDPVPLAAKVAAHGAELIVLKDNVGPAGARNAGLTRVRTPYVAFVDSDVRATRETLLALTAHFADPRVALVAPHVLARAVNQPPRWFERFEEASPALGLGTRGCVVRPGAAVAWLPSACLVARTDRLGDGFSSDMRVGEDVDLVWRLVASNQRVRYDPDFHAHHEARGALTAWVGRKFFYGTGGAALAARHPDNVVTAVLSPAMGVAALGVLARYRWSVLLALVVTARSVRVLHRTLPADVPGNLDLAVRLALRGLGWALRQESALVLRHWWPVAFAAALASRPARRIAVSAMVIDVASARFEAPGLALPTLLAGRRLDDLSYGAGLWWGSLRRQSARCLGIRVLKQSRGR